MSENTNEKSHAHPTPGLYLVILGILVIGTVLTFFAATWDMGMFNPIHERGFKNCHTRRYFYAGFSWKF